MLSPKEEAEWFGAESFEAERYKLTSKEIQFLVRNLRAVWIKYERGIYDEDEVLNKTERILYHTGVMQEEYGAESFDAETTIAKQYGETLDNLDDLQKIVKKTISPKRKPTKFIKDAKSSVVDSWKQMGKDGFRRQMYEPMEFEAEIPKSVKLGFGFGAGLALFQVAVIGSAIGLGMLLNKE